jgi:putative methanogenesis marker protein 8
MWEMRRMGDGRAEVEKLLEEIMRERGALPKDLHITRICCALVAISEGEIIKMTSPKLRYCPFRTSTYTGDLVKGIDDLSPEEKVIATIKQKICRFGHFTSRREICREDISIPYGASEMMMHALKNGGIDATVTVCDGAGTVITNNPSLVQGIGARMTGIFYTSPIKEVIEAIEKAGGRVLFPENAKIDQLKGLEKALELGYRKPAVTINGFAGEDLKSFRDLEERMDAHVTSLVVCTTSVSKQRAEEIGKYADLAWGCASLYVREIVGRKAKLQLGVKIPVFVLTDRGINFVSYYSPELKKHLREEKKYLISTHKKENVKYERIRIGDFSSYLMEIDELPVRTNDEPKPLI